MLPARVVAVDWSGARTGVERKIWLAECVHGEFIRLRNGWTRDTVTDELVRLVDSAVAAGERLVVGLDFSFGFPAWYAHGNGWRSGREVWRAFPGSRADAILEGGEPPFWGRGANRRRPALLQANGETPALRATERALRDAQPGLRPFSVFQLVGAGSVGVGSLRGMATLHALAQAGACVWPFDDDAGGAGAVVVELWPRVCAPHVVKSQPAARVSHVEALMTRTPSLGQYLPSVRTSDDAFDALVAAESLWCARAALERLPAARTVDEKLEGQIWEPLGDTSETRR